MAQQNENLLALIGEVEFAQYKRVDAYAPAQIHEWHGRLRVFEEDPEARRVMRRILGWLRADASSASTAITEQQKFVERCQKVLAGQTHLCDPANPWTPDPYWDDPAVAQRNLDRTLPILARYQAKLAELLGDFANYGALEARINELDA